MRSGLTPPRLVRVYLPRPVLRRAGAGKHRFVATLRAVLDTKGFETALHEASLPELIAAPERPGYALFRMIEPAHPNGLSYRRTYLPDFYRVERHARRWDWPVATARFDPALVNPAKAGRFVANWRHRLFGDVATHERGYVLVALQGQFLRRRSFQSCSPVEMLECLLVHDPRPVIATLHPKERYGPEDHAALAALQATYPRLRVQMGGSDALLPECDYVVTQNSAVALKGYFLSKPAALFAGADFHHIAARADVLGGGGAIAAAPGLRPDFAAYLWWFFRDHAVDVSRPDAKAALAAALIRAGWPLEAA